jgi:hypothetical protein
MLSDRKRCQSAVIRVGHFMPGGLNRGASLVTSNLLLQFSGVPVITQEKKMEYFEVPEARPGQDGICSDNDCPCGYPGAKIPRGTGYMYISKTVVDFRRDARTIKEVEQKVARMRQNTKSSFIFGQNVITSTLMCEQGARKRGLDLEVAAADAKYWWETGLVPLRATPLAGSPKPKEKPAQPKSQAQPAPVKKPAAPPAPEKKSTAPPAGKKWWEFWK